MNVTQKDWELLVKLHEHRDRVKGLQAEVKEGNWKTVISILPMIRREEEEARQVVSEWIYG